MNPEKKPNGRGAPPGLIAISTACSQLGIDSVQIIRVSQMWPDINTIRYKRAPNSKLAITCFRQEDWDKVERRVKAFQAGNLEGAKPTPKELDEFNLQKSSKERV